MNLNNYLVQIRRGTKRITLQRFLISKIVYGMEFSEIELAALFHNQLWLSAKATTDSDFKRKFGEDLESISEILREANFSRGLTPGSLANCRRRLLALSWDFPFPKRNVSTVETKLRNAIVLRWRKPEGVEIKRLPPEKYIGKGYRDKGTAKRPEFDGNPAWQEVASATANLTRQIKELINEAERTESNINKAKLLKKIQDLQQLERRISSYSRN